jgi:hypothetical protein
MPLILSGSVNISGSMTATTILVSSPGAGGMVSSSQQIQNYNLFAVTSSANTFYGNQTINGTFGVSVGGVSELNVQQTGVTIGNVVTDTHRVTGSLNISGSLIVGGTDVTHYIGESYGGGIVFYVYDGGKHGLISATSDQSTGTTWYNGGYAAANAPFDGINAGIRNTTSITTVYQTGSYAAEICAFFNGGNFGDWYLPSKYELNLLYQQKTIVGGFANETYWSSTELHPNNARASTQTFTNGVQNNHDKSSTFYVRAIRAF